MKHPASCVVSRFRFEAQRHVDRLFLEYAEGLRRIGREIQVLATCKPAIQEIDGDIEQTRGSPRLWASSARSKVSPSILSVLARRRRREVAIEAASTTWLSIPSLSKTR
jgi:hypothetical protein